MKKILYTMMGVGMLFAATSCEDFLDTSSPSEADVDFVFSEASTARAALYNAYEKWRGNAGVHSNGVFYDLVVCGSDAERHPEAYASQIARHVPENLYGYSDATFTKKGPSNYTISQYGNAKGTWESLYAIIATTNTLISAVEGSSAFAGFATQDGPSELSQIYGEAVALRATCYHELIRFYGDIPHQLQAGEEASEITPRDVIAEYHINKLKEVEPLMFRAGESSGIDKTFMTRTYVQGLIARMALMEGGYQTRRSDFGNDYYKDLDGNVLSFEKAGETSATQCFYGRRTDWEKFYKIAETYLTSAVNNSGTTALQVNDPRSSDKKTFGNPYQYVFQQMMDETIADENVYEIPETRGKQGERPYAFGRPSSGGGSAAYPCKNYGQSRFHAVYYYGDFDPNDMRRDVTCTVTGSTGDGSEKIIPFTMGSVANNGGIALNKWDENRQANPWVIKSRQAGINTPYMRFSDIILMLAEVKAALGDDASAKQYLSMVRNRAFASTSEANVDGFISKCGSVLDAVLEERKLEFGGEGIRRYDLIRNNKLGMAIDNFHKRTSAMISDLKSKGYHTFDNGNTIASTSEANVDGFISKCGSVLDAVLEERKLEFGGEGIRRYDLIRNNKLGMAIDNFHKRTSAMISDLKSKGYHTFDNGNTISSYIWVKKVNPADFGVNYRLTTTCTDKTNPVLFPGWRGQNDDWASVAASNGTSTKNLTAGNVTNLAIKGLFEYIDPNGSEAKALEADGYTKQPWGAKIVELENEYNSYVFNGYIAGEAPIYLIPYHPDVIKNSNGVLTNGYGFGQE